MARESIDLRVAGGPGGSGPATLLLEKPPVTAPVDPAAPPVVAPDLGPTPARALHVVLWRTAIAIAVLLAVVGMAAWASTPPA